MKKRSGFLDHVMEVIKTNHFSYSTEKTYIIWIYRFIVFHDRRHPNDMGGREIGVYLTHLDFKYARIGKQIPVVLSREETHKVISNLRRSMFVEAKETTIGELCSQDC